MVSSFAFTALFSAFVLSSAHFAFKPETSKPQAAPPVPNLLFLTPPDGPINPKILSFEAAAKAVPLAKISPSDAGASDMPVNLTFHQRVMLAQNAPSGYHLVQAAESLTLEQLHGLPFFSAEGRELGEVIRPEDMLKQGNRHIVLRLGGYMGTGGREVTLSTDEVVFLRDEFGDLLAVSLLPIETLERM